jgi:hypothetical protein
MFLAWRDQYRKIQAAEAESLMWRGRYEAAVARPPAPVPTVETWHACELRFAAIDASIAACWTEVPGEASTIRWWFTGTTQAENQELQFRAEECGALLRRSRRFAALCPGLLDLTDNAACWLMAVTRLVRHEPVSHGYHEERGEPRRNITCIERFPELSRLLCARLASEEESAA